MTGPLIEIKITKATLFLTPDEYRQALKRGKVIKRQRSFDARTKPDKRQANEI